MPTTWVAPEVFLRHKGVSITRIYKNDDADQGQRQYQYGWDEGCSDEAECFDVRDLPNPGGLDLSMCRNKRKVIKAAINAGIVTSHGVFLPGEPLAPDEILRELTEWERFMGGFEAPVWNKAKAYLQMLALKGPSQVQPPGSRESRPREAAQALLNKVCALLFWELAPGGRWQLNPHKSWSPDTIDEIARIVRPVCRGCDGVGMVLPSGDTCDECDGAGIAPDDWIEQEGYQ